MLSEYVKSGLFLEKRTKNMKYDCIITQYPFLSEYAPSCKVIVLDESDIQGSLAHALTSCTHPLVLLDTISLPFFLSLGDEKKEITLLSISSGYSAVGVATAPFLQDISLAISLGYTIYEPYDAVSLYIGLEQKGKVYIRVTSQMLPDMIGIPYQDIILLKILAADSSTALMFSGSFLANAVGVGDALEKQGKGAHVFLIPHLTFPSLTPIKEYLQSIGKLIIVLDQQEGIYEDYIKAKLYDIGVRIHSLRFIYPLYDKLTTVLPEYQTQQLEIDTEGLVKRIAPLI